MLSRTGVKPTIYRPSVHLAPTIPVNPIKSKRFVSVKALEQAPGLLPDPWTGSEVQLKALSQLRERFQSSTTAPAPDDETLMWYLRDRYFDVPEAEAKLRSMLRWKKVFQPGNITFEAVKKEYASGKAYVHEHADKYGRPAIIIRTKLHRVGEYPIDDSKRLCVHLIDTALAKLPPGREQIVGIFDLKDFGVPHNADFAFARFMIDAFFEYYPRRVGQVLMVDAPWVFGPAWEVIKPLMRKYASLVRFLTRDELKREFFTPDSLPKDFAQ